MPYLSLYVGGCLQGWHNDSMNGRFGFVYSLTRDQRRTIGGETLVRRETDAFRASLMAGGARFLRNRRAAFQSAAPI